MTASQLAPATHCPARPAPSDPRWMKAKEVSRKQLINALNHTNFREETVSLVFEHPTAGTSHRLKASPMPVLSDYPVFRFLQPPLKTLSQADWPASSSPTVPGRSMSNPGFWRSTAKG